MVGCDQNSVTGIDGGSYFVGTIYLGIDDPVALAHQSRNQQFSEQSGQQATSVGRHELVGLSDYDFLHEPLRSMAHHIEYRQMELKRMYIGVVPLDSTDLMTTAGGPVGLNLR
jgi:hypothetical protein